MYTYYLLITKAGGAYEYILSTQTKLKGEMLTKVNMRTYPFILSPLVNLLIFVRVYVTSHSRHYVWYSRDKTALRQGAQFCLFRCPIMKK